MTAPKPTLICDTECYFGYFLVAFKRVSDGKVVTIEMSDRTPRDEDDAKRLRVRSILLQNRIITFNGMGYDMPLLWYFISGATNAELKQASDRIINGRVRYWETERLLGISIPREVDHVDLIEPQPNPFVSLKTLNGRLHGRKMQDLPIEPDAALSTADMDLLTRYCGNDLDATHLLLNAIKEPIEMREAFSAEYKIDLRSKSDAQMGEAMIKRRVEQALGERVQKAPVEAGSSFPFKIPNWLKVEHPALREIVDKLRESQFYIQPDGKVEGPPWLQSCSLTIGETQYAMGIGGLHSTESNRALHSDDDHVLIDFDVASYYPAIILNSGLYPKALGPEFLKVFRSIRDERVAAKRGGDKTKDKGLKIAVNGCFGKLGSSYSVLYAPHLMIAITLGGQMALLMLIDRAERAGIRVVSGNTDGVVFRCPRHLAGPIENSRLTAGALKQIIEQWEEDTGFELEATEYRSLYSASVNSYYAFKPDGKPKVKGPGWTGRHESPPDMRTQLMKNPAAEICSLAVIELINHGTPLEQTIRACSDIRDFVTVVKVDGGATWRGEYLGKVVRYYWAADGEEIYRKKAHATTGNHAKVPKTDGCRPLMELPDELPGDIDYARYVAEAERILVDIGYSEPPRVVKPLRIYKHNAILWWAIAA